MTLENIRSNPGPFAPSAVNAGQEKPDTAAEHHPDLPDPVRFSCEACGATISSGTRGKPKRFCSDACRKSASRTPVAIKPTFAGKTVVSHGRDHAVHSYALIIKSEDGLRHGIESLIYILSDESARLAAQPDYWRRQMATRIAAALGFKLAE